MLKKRSSEAFTSYCDCHVYRKYVAIVYCSQAQSVRMDKDKNEGRASEDDEDAYESVGSGEDADNEGESKLMEFKQLKKKKKKEESAKSAVNQPGSHGDIQPGSQASAKEASKASVHLSGSKLASSRQSDPDQDTENDAASLSSVGNSNPASPIPHEGGGDISYTSDSEYTSAEESYTYSEDGGVDSFVVANLERNELKNRVIELEENLRGKQAVLKDLNKENYELRAKLQSYQTGSRQESSPSPVLRRELESLQETLRENQKRLEDINKENHEMRTKLAHTGHDDKSISSKFEEMKMALESKQQMLEALNFQNQELIKENNTLKSKQKEKSPDSSQSDSQIESLQESIKTKQKVLSELNKQNEELRGQVRQLSQAGIADNQAQAYKQKIGDMRSEIGLKDDEIERLKAIEISFLQMKDVMKELSLQSIQAKEELQRMKERYDELEAAGKSKERVFQERATAAEEQFGKVQDEYHNIVTVNNDHLMKIQILESQIGTLESNLQEKDEKIAQFDAQVSLAIGERDAVQLEARTQVEDFEEKLKAMQDQLQKNGKSIRDYEAEISRATEDLAITRELVAQSEKILSGKDEQIFLLEKKLEAAVRQDNQSSNEREIYTEEIENLKAKVEEDKCEIARMNEKFMQIQTALQNQLAEKDLIIVELEREKAALEKLRGEEVDNLQVHFDKILQEQQDESKKILDDTVAQLNEDNEKQVKAIEDNFASKIDKMKSDLEKAKEEQLLDLQEKFEKEQRSRIEVVQEEVTKAVSEKSLGEIRTVVMEKDEQIYRLEGLLKVRNEELDQCQENINRLEHLCAEKDEEFNTALAKKEFDLEEKQRAKDELTHKVEEAEKRASCLDTDITSVRVENEKFAKENELLQEKITELIGVKEVADANFEAQIVSLKEDYESKMEIANMETMNLRNSAEKDKAEFLQFVDECGVLKEQLQKSLDSEHSLKVTIESLEKEQTKSNSELEALIEGKRTDSDKIAKLKLEADSLKEMLDIASNERSEVCKEYEAEVQMLKERLEIIKTENNNEMIEGFNQSMDRLKQEKDEQIRNLREEVAHIREGHDKYIHKMQSDFESDMKHVEDENYQLKEKVKDLQEAKHKEIFSIESSLKMELEAIKEKHASELKTLRMDIQRELEEEQLRLKEDQWQQLRRYEAERELELKRVIEEGETRKTAELELLRQQLEEEKHREMHDVICNMTKEQKDNTETLKSDMEKQLRKVQEDRDTELRNIKQEYKSFAEAKRQEMEDLMSSQMSKYQEEQETLKKRLNKAEGRVRKLMNEKEDLLKQDKQQKEELENLRSNMAIVEKNQECKSKNEGAQYGETIVQEQEDILESSRQDYSRLMELFEDWRKELHNLSGEGEQDTSGRMDEKALSKSLDQSSSFEFEGSSLDKELSEIKRLCKGEIIDLAYKLKCMKQKFEDREKEFSDLSFVNQGLKDDVERLEVELRSTHEHSGDVRGDQGLVFAEGENLSKESPQKSFDIIDGTQQIKDLKDMTEKLQEVSAAVESKMKLKEELDASISDLKLELDSAKSEKKNNIPLVVKEESAISAQLEETMIVPEMLEELKTIPMDEVEGPESIVKADEEKARTEQVEEKAGCKDMELEVKHLQRLLIDNNEKQEQQKKEIKELRDALENERSLFAEQLRARVAKETEAKEAQENRSAEAIIRERRELMGQITMLEQRLKDKDRIENELKDENWRLVNLLKDNSVELLSEKESLQEQVEKQEDIVKEMQQKLSTGDLVSSEIQEAFGRQLAALHRQRDALIEQLEQHKKEHQGYAKVVQEKAALEERLRDEKKTLAEKLRQKETLEVELAAERAALNEKLIELEKLKEMLNGKERLAHELAEQRDELKNELTAVEERLCMKEEDLCHQQEELERELSAKDLALKKWEEDFRARETELIEHEESLQQHFSDILAATRNDFEFRNEENLRQLRTDLDADYRQRIEVTESGLHSRYGQEMERLKEEHDNQLQNWLDLSEWLLDSMLSMPCFKMNRARGEFEEKLIDLRRQLEEERLRQVRATGNVLEREHSSREVMDLGKGHDVDMEELRRELEENHRLEIEAIKWEYEQAQRGIMEELQATLITESAIHVGAARLRAEQEVGRQLQEIQEEIDKRVEERVKNLEKEKENAIKTIKKQYDKEMQEKVDEVMRDMQAEKEAEIEQLLGDNSVEAKINFFERQMSGRPDPQRIQANMELDTRHEKEVEKVKSELVQKCGNDDEMFHTLGEFESVQENYFQEKLKYVEEEHEIHLETIVKDYEILLLKTKNELDILREEDFQRIRRLQDEIYAKEEQVLEVRKLLEDETEQLKKEMQEEKERHYKEMARKSEDQIALLAKEREVWEDDKHREIAVLRSQYDGLLADKDYSCEMRLQDLRGWYENEMGRTQMEFIQREEIIKANYGQNQVESRIQMLQSQHEDQLRSQDTKHREELEQAAMQLSSNLRQSFNSCMAEMKAKHEEEKVQMRKDFKKVKKDALDDVREELAADYNIQLKEMRAELEHNKVADIAKATTQISMKNALDLENLRKELTEKYELEIEAIKEELQKDFEANSLRQAAEIEELEFMHAGELKVTRELEDHERRRIRQELEEEFSKIAIDQAKHIQELEMRHVEELRLMRERYELGKEGTVDKEVKDDLAENAIRLAQQMEELEMKHADEMRRLRQKYERKSDGGIKQDMRDELDGFSPLQSDHIREIESEHEKDLKQIKERYELLLAEKTQELQSEVNVLKCLLEESQKEMRRLSHDVVDAVPSAPPLNYFPGSSSTENLVIPAQEFDLNTTPSGSTETLIPRFIDGGVVNALNDAYKDMSSDDGSRVETSISGSVPSLLFPGGHPYPVVRSDAGHDEVEQTGGTTLAEMKRRFRPSDSDSSRSYDQMMEPGLVEDENIAKLMREKEYEMQTRLAKQKEEIEGLYQARIRNLDDYILRLKTEHAHEVQALAQRGLRQAEEQVHEVKEVAAIEKVHLQKEAYLNQMALNEQNEKILKKFMKEQEKAAEELKNEHIEELAMLKHELTMQHEREVKDLGKQHSKYVLETRDRYEKVLKEERAKFEMRHAEDAKRLKQLMEKDLEERQKDLVHVLKDQYESDLKHAKQNLEDSRREAIDDLTKTHMLEIERVKETQRRELTEKFQLEMQAAGQRARMEYDDFMRRDLSEKVYFEIEKGRKDAAMKYENQLHQLEDELEDTHVKQLQALQDVREKNKENMDKLKQDHQQEIENIEKGYEEKIQALKESLHDYGQIDVNALELNFERDLKKHTEELNEIHLKELDELNKELIAAKAKITALDDDKSIKEKTYTDTIQKLMEDYDNEIKKLKEAVEKYRKEELEKHDRNVVDMYNTDQRIIKQNFEQQMSELNKHHELEVKDLKAKLELEKREWLEDHVEKYEKKMEELKKMYDEERKEYHNEMLSMDDEHTKQMDSLMNKIQSLSAENETARKNVKELKEENDGLTNKVKIANDQYSTLVARHERQEEENSKYIKMISSDVEKCEKERNNLRQGNERLLQSLSNAVRASALIEDMISRNLDTLIQETSRTESGAGDSGARRNGGRRGSSPDRSLRARLFGGSPSKSKKGESEVADWTQYSNLSGGSLLSDEGLDLSFISQGKLFSGTELDANSEEIVRGAGERLHIAVEHILRMLNVAARQTQEARQAYDEAASRANDEEEKHRKARDDLAEQLKSALKDLEKEEELRKKWEADARQKNSQVHKMSKENDELKQKMDEIMRESAEKDKLMRITEDKCIELESEKDIIARLKNDLELKLAELRTHRDKDSHDIRVENEDLKLRLARAGEITGDELSDVLSEIVELKEEVGSLSNEKESLKEQLKDSKVKELKSMKEVDILKQSNIEILQTNKELLEQNEALMVKSRNLESAFEETLEERFLPQSETAFKDLGSDSVDGGDRTVHDKITPSSSDKGFGPPGGSGRKANEEISRLLEEVQELKEYTEILKETNDNLCIELDKKHETELDLLNKISELEDDLYRSAQEGFESEKDDKETLIRRRTTMELNLKHAYAENEKLRADLEKKENEFIAAQEELRKAREFVAESSGVYTELENTKSLLSDRDTQYSTLMTEAEQIRKALFSKDSELSTAESELFELRDTVDDQKLMIENQDKKILDLLQKQESGEKTEQYVQELMQEIQKEKEMVVEKDNEIQTLLEKLDVRRTQGDGEDSESKLKKLKSLQEEVLHKEKEIKRLKKAVEDGDEKCQELERAYEINLQKTIHHIKTEMGRENEIRLAELKAEHQAEIDRMLETSKLELTELGQQFEEQIGAAERVNLHLLQNFFKNRTLNESQMPATMDENTPVESLLNDLQSEAENIANLVTSYQISGVDPESIEELQNSWAKEKQILLEAVKALRELVAKASGVTASDAAGFGEDWRATLLKAIEEIFTLDTDLLNAEVETLESIPTVASQSADLIAEKRKRLADQRKNHSQILRSLNNKDRESLLQEITQLKIAVEDLTAKIDHYKGLLDEVETRAKQTEGDLVQQFQSEIEQERSANTQLELQLEEERNRNLELETLINNERNTVTEMRNTLESDEEKIRDLVSALEIEQAELKEIRDIMTNEQSKTQKLEEELNEEKDRSEKYRKNLDTERKRLEEMTIKGKANVEKLENLLQEKVDQQDDLNEKVLELTEEKSRLLKAAELEQNHSRKVESLCEDLKSKAVQEKNERQRIEKIAERYQANLEEMTKLFEDEKSRRIKSESALQEKVNNETEAGEKGQQDATDKETLKEMLKDASTSVANLKGELDKAKAKIVNQDAEIVSLQSESALKIAEIKKQNAERISEMSDIVARSKHDFADEIERERTTSRQLRDALNALQTKFETSRSQYTRLRQSFDEADGSRDASQTTPKSSPINRYSVSSRALDPFVIRCNKLLKNCQDVIANEQQRMEYGFERPSERHIKELQSTFDALDALVKELDVLQQDLRALEQHDQCNNSPTARLEQSHKKNEELRDHIRKLVREKSEFRSNLAALEEQIMEYRKREEEIEEVEKASRDAELQLKSEQLTWEAEKNALKSELLKLEAEKNALKSELLKLEAEKSALGRSLDSASLENENLRNTLSRPEPFSPSEDVNAIKVVDSGWSIQKVQKLYGRCLRAESFRKALIYQKKYLLFLLGGFQETEAITLSMIAKMNDASNLDGTSKQQAYGKSRAFMRFRTAARVVIATWRMKFLVRKWSKSVSKISLKSAKRDAELNGSPSAPMESVPGKRDLPEKLHNNRPVRIGSRSDETSDESRANRNISTIAESRFRKKNNGVEGEYHLGDKRYDDARRGRQRDKENVRSRPRIERYDKIDTDSDPSSYAALRHADESPPRAYPRPMSPKRNNEPFADTDDGYLSTKLSGRPSSRPRSPHSRGTSPGRTLDSKHQRSLSASGLDETNTSLSAYIKKLEILQAKLKSQGTDSSATDSRRF